MNKNRHTNVWQKHAHKCMKKIYSNTGAVDSQLQRPGVPCSRAPQPWQGSELPCLQLSAHHYFCWAVSGDWTANPLVIRWPHSPLRHGEPKYKCKNEWKKQACKCMKKTGIQIYDKNRHTNAWKKTGIQMYEENMYKNVWKKEAYECMKKQAYKCMKKTGIQMYEKNTHTNVWEKHAYKHAYKCMTKTSIQTRIQMYDKNRHTNTYTNVWKNIHNCMKKTRIPNRIQVY